METTDQEAVKKPRKGAAFRELVKRLRDELDYWNGRKEFEPSVDEPPEPPRPDRYRLQWEPADASAELPVVSLAEARRSIREYVGEYLDTKRPGKMVLIRAQPGVGKTYAAVEIAQDAAAKGMRVFYAMPTHKHFDTLGQMDHFDPNLWYHWQAYDAESAVTGNTMCIYPEAFRDWTAKGYPAMKLCESLCAMYKENCEFRRQRLVTQPIIAGLHDHIALGLSISKFDLVIIDELPVRAFIRPREIPRKGIKLDETAGPAMYIGDYLISRPVGKHESVSGPTLMDEIGPWMDDLIAQVIDYKGGAPTIPWISKPEDVEKAGYWYIPDLLTLAIKELEAHRRGMPAWLERIVLTDTHLRLLKRPEPWNKLPPHIVALDATGNAQAYSTLMQRRVQVVEPSVKRRGKVRQIVYRLNGIGTMILDEKDDKGKKTRRLAHDGVEMLELCKAIAKRYGYRRPGAVTFQGGEAEFVKEFGPGNVLHFYGMRGSNDFVGRDGERGVDANFVVGCPQPSDKAIMEMVKVLYQNRMRPFTVAELDGRSIPARCEVQRRYNIFRDGKQATRLVSGFWNDPDLETVAAIWREDELVQAVHRNRPIDNDYADVWLITSAPTAEPLDEIFDQPEEVFGNTPISWKAWLKIEAAVPEWRAENKKIRVPDVAKVTGLSEGYLARIAILREMLRYWPDLFEIDALGFRKQGRPSLTLVVKGLPDEYDPAGEI